LKLGIGRTVRHRRRDCYIAMGKSNRIRYGGRCNDGGINMDGLDNRRRQQIERTCVRMRMERFHVDHTLVFCRRDFGQMCMN